MLSQAAKDVVERRSRAGHAAGAGRFAYATTGMDRPLVTEAQLQFDHAFRSVRERTVLAGHNHAVETAAFSPDGRLVATASRTRRRGCSTWQAVGRSPGWLTTARFTAPISALTAAWLRRRPQTTRRGCSMPPAARKWPNWNTATLSRPPSSVRIASCSRQHRPTRQRVSSTLPQGRKSHGCRMTHHMNVDFSPNGKLLAINYGDG